LDSFSGSNKTAILMIDQIEDNIDNKYISGRLVETIRKLKKDMQMILVTHNPSIAVYGDAENIIICENTENGFLYKQGGLENKEIREEACEILDGGDIAFKNRMDKYNIEKFNSLVHGDAA
jgi:DNA repair ATPase RecN